jgi:hypothetical protein
MKHYYYYCHNFSMCAYKLFFILFVQSYFFVIMPTDLITATRNNSSFFSNLFETSMHVETKLQQLTRGLQFYARVMRNTRCKQYYTFSIRMSYCVFAAILL